MSNGRRGAGRGDRKQRNKRRSQARSQIATCPKCSETVLKGYPCAKCDPTVPYAARPRNDAPYHPIVNPNGVNPDEFGGSDFD